MHCKAALHAESNYTLCPDCSHYYRTDYGTCPLCVVAAVAQSTDKEAGYTTEAQERKSREGKYYWQLFMDYAADNAVADSPASTVAANGNSNGHGKLTAPTNGKATTPTYSNGTGNGHSPYGSNSNGSSSNGHSQPPATAPALTWLLPSR